MVTHYETFLNVVETVFNGTQFNYERSVLRLSNTILSPYDLIREIRAPLSVYEKYISSLPEDFLNNARTELYRGERGWIDRGVEEGRIIKYSEMGITKIIPRFNEEIIIGIDSSRNMFVVCCFDNYLGGIRYLENFIRIPRDFRKNEFKWNNLDNVNRTYIITRISTLLNISCKALFAINSSFINSTNRLTRNQFTGLIEGCFTGYTNHPTQNSEVRSQLRNSFFRLCDNNQIHCDPDFGSLQPRNIVRLVVRNLSRRDGRIQPCTPSHALLRSHESEPIQLADLIVGAFSDQRLMGQIPPIPTEHLFFNDKKISKKDRRNGNWAKAYYWLRNGG
jgi:hypothetical protein